MKVEGSLGGLQLLDLTPEGSRHQKVFSVGQDPSTNMKLGDEMDMYKSALDSSRFQVINEDSDSNKLKAFTFDFRKGGGPNDRTGSRPGSTVNIQVGDDEVKDEMMLTLHLASLCYIHVPRFLHEVTLCMDEFQSSIANLANSIQKAASDAAREFVQSKMPDLVTSFSPSMFNTMLESPGPSQDNLRDSTVMDMTDSNIPAEQSDSSITFDIVMETPVIIIPRTATSSEMLVGHLGDSLSDTR